MQTELLQLNGALAPADSLETIDKFAARLNEAPPAPEMYPPASSGVATVDTVGNVILPKGLADWQAGFTRAMRLYPFEAQATLNEARRLSGERCDKREAEAVARAEAAIAIQGQDVWTAGDLLQFSAIVGVVCGVAGFVIGFVVANDSPRP